MKVYIGPYGYSYISAFRIQDWIMEKKYTTAKWWELEPEQMDRFDLAVEKFCGVLQKVLDYTINKITRRERNIRVRIDPYDTWSMDHTLALIIHPMLVQLLKTNHGYFHSDPEDVPHIGKGEVDELGLDDKEEERYRWIMEEMIWAFNQIANGDEFEEFYTEEGKWDLEAKAKQDERIGNALRLFGKYFRGLWD